MRLDSFCVKEVWIWLYVWYVYFIIVEVFLFSVFFYFDFIMLFCKVCEVEVKNRLYSYVRRFRIGLKNLIFVMKINN